MSTIENDALSRVSADSVTAKNAIKGKSAEDMGMNEFFTLLAAQMTNQDMMNPESNTEFIAQMAQFSALKGVQTIQDNQMASYAVSYTGKDVTIASVNAKGDLETIKGTVESVTFYDGQPQVVVNGKKYPLHQIMEVNTDLYSKNEQSAGNALSLVSGYIGKTVTVSDVDDEGVVRQIQGEVKAVTLIGGKPYVLLENGKEYAYSAINSVTDKLPPLDNTDTGDNGVGAGDGVGDGDGDETGTEGVTPSDPDTDDGAGTEPDPDPEPEE